MALEDAHAIYSYYKHDGTLVRHAIDYDSSQDRRLGGRERCGY